jgi:uncharacterized protein YdaU (DUF1376 family)
VNFYHRYVGNYIKKTLDLDMTEDGAYTRLLDWMYANERLIPHGKRYTLTRCQTPAERRAVDTVLAQFFERVGDEWTHEGVLDVIEEARPRIEAARENGKKGGRPKGSTSKPTDGSEQPETGTQEKPNGFPPNNPNGTQSESSPHPHSHPDSSLRSENTHRDFSTAEVRVLLGGTDAGTVCKAMKAHGVFDVNPGHLDLLDLLKAGAELAEFVGAAQQARDRQKGFAYALGIVKRRREEAATAKPLHQGAMPQRPPTQAELNTLAAGYAIGTYGTATFDPQPDQPETIDAPARLIAP